MRSSVKKQTAVFFCGKNITFFAKKRLTFTGRLAIIIPVVRPTAKAKTKYADVAELADALDSGSSGHCARAGSSPVIRSIAEETIEKIGGLFLCKIIM